MLKARLLAGGGVDALYSDDVFQAYIRTGTGSSATVTTGINLSAKGGMIWSKGRSGATDHAIYDTARGATFDLASNLASAQTTQAQGLTAFGTTGHTWGTLAKVNTNTATCVDYVFAKAPKFFDVVTWTGNGANRTITHSLGQEVGLILVKRTDTAADWQGYHRSLANTEYMVLNSSAAKAAGATRWNSTTATTSVFSVGTDITVNASGGTYVAYLFAHDTSTDGIIQCGSFTISGGARQTITLGWEPQYLLLKGSSVADPWEVLDTSRVLTTDTTAAMLQPDTANAESPAGTSMGARLTATGFTAQNSNGTYIYLAIRRPNKPPTVGTQVYQAIARTGTGAAATVTGVGFAPDLVMPKTRSAVGYWGALYDRLRGATKFLQTTDTAAEATDALTLTSFGMDGFSVGTDASNLVINGSAKTYINWCFKRAVGVFDEVCYTGTGVAKTVAHGLGAVPELMIVKSRSNAETWAVYSVDGGATKYLSLNSTNGFTTLGWWNNTTPTAAVFSLGAYSETNGTAFTYVAYLFATKAGISKVGTYTGNGSSLTLNMGFTTGARFFMCKRTDSTGDWYVFDTTRGIIAGNDGHLSLNTTAAEVTTDDSVDPDTSGLIVNQVAATNINVNAATYIYLAFA